jgi:hypothetical protein
VGWIEQQAEPPPVSKRTLAAVVVGQSRRYSRAVQRRVLIGTAVVGTILLYLGVVSVLYGTQQATTPILEVKPFSTATIVGIYTALGAIVVALQFGARTVLDTPSQDVQALARNLVQRSFLEGLAWAALLTSITMGLLTAYWHADFPLHFDVGRILGALTASAFLAFTAAETQLLMATPLSEELRAIAAERRIALLRRTLAYRLPVEHRPGALLPQRVALFVAVPALSLATSVLVLPTTSFPVLIGRALIVFGATLTAYILVRGVWQAVVDRNTSTIAAIVVIGFLMGLSVLTSIGEGVLATKGDAVTVGDFGRGVLGLWVTAILFPLTGMCLGAIHGRGRSGVIVHDVRAAAQRRLTKLERPIERQPAVPLGRLVPWAWASVVVFPFGIVLGLIAAADASMRGHRGASSARAAAWSCGALAVIGGIAVAVVGCQA